MGSVNLYSESSEMKLVLVMPRLIFDVRSENGVVDYSLALHRLVKLMFSPGWSMHRYAKTFFKRRNKQKTTNLRFMLLKYSLTTYAGITWLSSHRPVGTGPQGTKLQHYSGCCFTISNIFFCLWHICLISLCQCP